MSPWSTSVLGIFFAVGGVGMGSTVRAGGGLSRRPDVVYPQHAAAQSLPQYAVRRVSRTPRATARRRANARGTGDAVRRVPAPLLAACGLRARLTRGASPRPHHGRGSRGVPRQERARGAASAPL